jgi:hypothetical protein
VIEAAHATDSWLWNEQCRFICGTQDIHKELKKLDFVEQMIQFFYAAAFDANGVFVFI